SRRRFRGILRRRHHLVGLHPAGIRVRTARGRRYRPHPAFPARGLGADLVLPSLPHDRAHARTVRASDVEVKRSWRRPRHVAAFVSFPGGYSVIADEDILT